MLSILLKNMSVRWICLTILISIGNVALAESFDKYIGDLPNEGIYFFKVDQVPRSVTVYWDYHSDRVPDKAFVCPMVDHGRVVDCSREYPFDAGDPDTYIFSTCPNSDYPTYYLTTRDCWECDLFMNFLLPDKTIHPFVVNNVEFKLCKDEIN